MDSTDQHNRDLKDFAHEVARELDARRTVDEKTHAAHHEFIRMLVEKHESRKKLMQAVGITLATTAAMAVLYGVWNVLVFIWNDFPRGPGHG